MRVMQITLQKSEAPPGKVRREVTGGREALCPVECLTVLPSVCCSSEDDPFLLYATLNSGSHCKFITKDLMRDHKACLPDARAQHLFFKWQQGHQLAVRKGFRSSHLTLLVWALSDADSLV